MASKGFLRLSDANLRILVTLQGKLLAGVDPKTCAAIARGNHTRSQFVEALSHLAPQDVDRWLALSREAGLAELKNAPPRKKIEQEKVHRAMEALLRKLPQDRAAWLRSVLADMSASSDEDACRATRTLYQGATSLEEPHRSILAQALVQ